MARVISQEQLLRILREELPILRQRYGVTRLAVYGSFAHWYPGPRSDVDLLVDLERPLGLDFLLPTLTPTNMPTPPKC